MENASFVPDIIPADLEKSWHIPRPTLAHSSKSSKGSTSSNNSTHSARSGSLLLTAANLAQIQTQNQHGQGAAAACEEATEIASTRDQNIRYYLESAGAVDALALHAARLAGGKKPEPDTASMCSSTHFTVDMSRQQKQPRRSFCKKHRITLLVLSMSALFTIGIVAAIFMLEMRAKNQRY